MIVRMIEARQPTCIVHTLCQLFITTRQHLRLTDQRWRHTIYRYPLFRIRPREPVDEPM